MGYIKMRPFILNRTLTLQAKTKIMCLVLGNIQPEKLLG